MADVFALLDEAESLPKSFRIDVVQLFEVCVLLSIVLIVVAGRTSFLACESRSFVLSGY